MTSEREMFQILRLSLLVITSDTPRTAKYPAENKDPGNERKWREYDEIILHSPIIVFEVQIEKVFYRHHSFNFHPAVCLY